MATIGSLTADLLLNSAQFIRELDKASAATKKNASFMQQNINVAKAAFVAAAAAGAVAVTAIGKQVYETIGTFDALGKTAQKIGIPVEELSRLKHAADLSDVSLQTLQTSVQRLSRNMLDAAEGTGEAVDAFRALQIDVKNSDGTLKSASQVMTEVAARFEGMEDGAAKTALAMKVFGRAGAELIPLLNSGADGLNEMMQEAEDLGIVIDTKTAKAAEQFNDNLTRLGKVWDGVIGQITIAVAGPLAKLTDKLVAIAKDGDLARKVSAGMAEVINTAAAAAESLARNIDTLILGYKGLVAVVSVFNLGQFGAVQNFESAKAAIKDFKTALDETTISAAQARDSLPTIGIDQLGTAATETAEEFEPLIENQKETAAAQKAANAAMSEAARIFESTRTPAEAFDAKLAELNEHLRAGRIDFDTYTRAVNAARNEFPSLTSNMTKFFTDMGDNTKQATTLFQGAFNSLTDTLSEFFQGAKFDFDKLLKSLTKGIADFMASKVVSAFGELLLNLVTGGGSGALGGLLGGGGGLLGGLLDGIGSIFGFAQGGSFKVPGAPGIDKPVMIGAAGGETVSITPATKSMRDGGARGGDIRIMGFNPRDLYTGKQLDALLSAINERLRDGQRLVMVR